MGGVMGKGGKRLRMWALSVGVVFLASGALLLARPDLRQSLAYDLKSHTGTPTSLALAVAPDSRDLFDPGQFPMRFAVAGDVGTGGVEEVATAQAMAELEGAVEYTALLLLGDNVYEDGDPGEIQSSLFSPFADVLDNGTELLPVLGNHDVDSGFGDAQVAALGMSGPWYSVAFGGVRIVALDSNRPDDADQLEWLAQTLAASEERWKIVLLHHPPYSGGWHGSDFRVRKAFGPLFEENGVQLVLAGHDHDYQRSEPINGVTYVVSGGAAQLRPAHLADFSVVAWSAYHFLDIAVWDDHLELRAIDQELGVIDEVVIRS